MPKHDSSLTIHSRSPGGTQRHGAIVILAAAMAVVLVSCLAFAIDVGYLCTARSQAQHCADATALAAALEMTSNDNLKMGIQDRIAAATEKGLACAALQDINYSVNSSSPEGSPAVIEQIVFGRLEDPENPNEQLSFADPDHPNAVFVKVACDPARGTAIPLFFARIFGLNTAPISATAVAAFTADATTGFDAEEEKPNTLMPFVVSEPDWNEFLANGSDDNWTYDPKTRAVTPGPDGIPELKMYPEYEQGNAGITPGNFGTVDIGNHNNSAADMNRQILDGPTPEDLAPYGGELVLDELTNTLELIGATNLEFNGDTGISASMKDALAQIKGDPKTIMIYNHVEGVGDNTNFTISGFVGVRVLDFDVTTAMKKKFILIQPAMVQDSSAVEDGDSDTSDYVGRPIRLVR
jgi:hypothetical protein